MAESLTHRFEETYGSSLHKDVWYIPLFLMVSNFMLPFNHVLCYMAEGNTPFVLLSALKSVSFP